MNHAAEDIINHMLEDAEIWVIPHSRLKPVPEACAVNIPQANEAEARLQSDGGMGVIQ